MRSSTDSGLIWDPEGQATSSHYAWDSDIALTGDTIHVVWEDEGTGLAHRSIYYTRSTDGGVTWDYPYWIDQTLDDSADPALVGSNGRVYVVWTDSRPNPDTSLCCGLYISHWEPEPDEVNDEQDNLPIRACLSAYPNPFNSSVAITYYNLKGGEIGIYDIQGKLIRTLKVEGGENGKIIWDACDASGKRVSSGEYFLKAGASQNSTRLKLLYLK